jgi:Flp pilus assembly protein TadG
MHHMQVQHRRGCGNGGYSVVEFVIILLVVVIATLYLVQFGLHMLARSAAQSAAQEGVRAARAYRADASTGRDAASSYVERVAPRLLRSVRVEANRSPTTATIRVRATVLHVAPALLGADTFTVNEVAAGPVERFIPPDGT